MSLKNPKMATEMTVPVDTAIAYAQRVIGGFIHSCGCYAFHAPSFYSNGQIAGVFSHQYPSAFVSYKRALQEYRLKIAELAIWYSRDNINGEQLTEYLSGRTIRGVKSLEKLVESY